MVDHVVHKSYNFLYFVTSLREPYFQIKKNILYKIVDFAIVLLNNIRLMLLTSFD
jgi:hypothetical protein